MVAKIMFLLCSILYACSVFTDASSLSAVTSLVSGVMEQNVPARISVGHGRQMKRYKREVQTKMLDDPDRCIRHCRDNETAKIITASVKNMAQLVAIALRDVKGDETETPEKEAAFSKRIEETTIANMGPFFQDLCDIAKDTDDCYVKCPTSQLRNLSMLDHSTADVFCEPGKNWENFTVYWNAVNCTNATELEKPCETKCGPEVKAENVTTLDMDEPEDEDGIQLKYETDAKKNTAAFASACKSIKCYMDCYKPIMTERCGAKAYDLYARMTKVGPRTTFRTLDALDAVDQVNECKNFQ